jgi:translation initiation factor IF-3
MIFIVVAARVAATHFLILQEITTIATKRKSFTRVNGDIRVPQVRLIGADGEQVGVVDTAKAIEIAEEAELDLVEIAPEARPPVCRIVDYGKFRYDKEKKAKEARKRQHNVQMKGIRIAGANISEHDLEYRISHIREFIEKGNRVKVSVRFRGRQMAYQEKGRELLRNLGVKLEDIAVVDQEPRMEGREMSLILRPI